MLVSPAPAPTLLLVAHGTRSVAGQATTGRIRDAVAAHRPQTPVRLCFLDVVEPRLPQTLAATDATREPTIVVPLLLSTGRHAGVDIPAAIAGRTHVVAAPHLGPDPVLAEVLAQRLQSLGPTPASTVLVGAGSSQADGRAELAHAGALLAERLGRPVGVLSMADALSIELARLPSPVHVATYLLAEGTFTEALQAAADGRAAVAAPLGVHDALVRLVWSRYDDATHSHVTQ